MSKNEKAISPQNKEFRLIQKKFAGVDKKNNYKTEETESIEKNTNETNLKDKNKIFKNIHTTPAEEQQLENNPSDFDNKK